MSHKKRIALTCPDCRASRQVNVPSLLESAAESLTACKNSGLDLKFRHGALVCEEGFIFQLDDGSFVARTRAYSPFSMKSDNVDD